MCRSAFEGQKAGERSSNCLLSSHLKPVPPTQAGTPLRLGFQIPFIPSFSSSPVSMFLHSASRLISHMLQPQSSRSFVLQFSSVSAADKLFAHLQENQGNLERALTLYKVKLDSACVSEILHRFHPSQFRLGLRFFIWAGTRPDYRHSPFMYSKACDVFKIKRTPELIEDILEAYRTESFSVCVKTAKVILNLCKQAKLSDEALRTLRKFPEFNVRPDTTAYNQVIKLFIDKGDVDTADKLMKEMGLIDLQPDMITYESMIKGFCDVGRLEDAFDLSNVMRNHGCVPNVVTFSTLIDGLCRFGDMEKALQLLEEMENEAGICNPNTVTYTSIIQALCQKKKMEKALEILDRMETRECFPNRVTASSLILQLCQDDRVNEVHKLIVRLTKWGGVSVDECYSSLVISFVVIKRFDEAEKVFREMLTGGIKIDGPACTYVFKELCSNGRFLDCFYLYEKVEKRMRTSEIESEIFSVLLLGLYQQGHLIEARKLIKLMQSTRIRLKACYFEKVLEHLERSKDEESILHLTQISR